MSGVLKIKRVETYPDADQAVSAEGGFDLSIVEFEDIDYPTPWGSGSGTVEYYCHVHCKDEIVVDAIRGIPGFDFLPDAESPYLAFYVGHDFDWTVGVLGEHLTARVTDAVYDIVYGVP